MLAFLFNHLQQYLPPGTKVIANLLRQPNTLPTDLPMDLRPDLVVYSPGQLHLLELTVCWEANFSSEKLRKSKNLHLVEQACSTGAQATLSTIQVGCRGFINRKSLQHFFAPTSTSAKVQRSLTSKIIKTVFEESYNHLGPPHPIANDACCMYPLPDIIATILYMLMCMLRTICMSRKQLL